MNKPGTILVISRGISTSSTCQSRKNFRKFLMYNKAGTKQFQEDRKAGKYPDIPWMLRGMREPGYKDANGKFVYVPEMVPQLIVPNLENCNLLPYVSYRAPDVTQSEFTAEDLFHEVYAQKIVDDWNNKKLKENGHPIEASPNELLDSATALINARKTGADIFTHDELDCDMKGWVEEAE